MKVLLGTSPRSLSARFTREIGNVNPTFIVLSDMVVPPTPVLYIVPPELYTYLFQVAISL